jgi:hypothetical protein
MALSILDGNQSATTLSTILSSGQHITAHTVVSLGTQAITDIVNATSAGLTNTQLRASAVTVGGTVTVGNSLTISSLPAISGTVTANVFGQDVNGNIASFEIGINGGDNASNAIPIGFNDLLDGFSIVASNNPLPISGTVTIGSALPAGTNRIGVVTIGGGTVTIGAGTAQIGSVTASISNFPATQAVSLTTLPALVAGTAQIGSVTASISGTVPVSGTFFQATQPASLASLPALAAGTNQIGSVTASISGTVPISISSVTVGNSVTIGSLPAISGTVTANIAISSTAITSGSFTSLTSATLVPANTARKMATVYNLGAGQLFVNAGATATTLGGGFMVALSSGDFYECDYTTTTLSGIFATAGTASWISH